MRQSLLFPMATFVALSVAAAVAQEERSSSGLEDAAEHTVQVAIKGTEITRHIETEGGRAGYTVKHMLIEAGAKVPVVLTREGNDWNSDSRIAFFFTGVQLYFGDGTPILEGELCPFESVPTLYAIASGPSTVWDDAEIHVTAQPRLETNSFHRGSFCENSNCGCLSGLTFAEPSRERRFFSGSGTAYSITIEVMEKPWGGTWNRPENSGTRVVDGVARNWFMLWGMNNNAIRANVEPPMLAELATGSSFTGLSVEDFDSPSSGPDGQANPKWKTIVSGSSQQPVKATIHVGTVPLSGTQNGVDL